MNIGKLIHHKIKTTGTQVDSIAEKTKITRSTFYNKMKYNSADASYMPDIMDLEEE